MPLQVFAQAEAQNQIRDQVFVDKWQRLVSACTWSTFFQDADFVRIWFEHYGDEYWPLVITESDDRGELKNLLLLAVDRATGTATSPGAHQAEYHCWLSKDGEGAPFLSAALSKLSDLTGQDRITFKFIPPCLTERLDQVRGAVVYPAMVRTEKTPVVCLTATPPPWESLQKKGNRSKLARLRRLGRTEIRISESGDQGVADLSRGFVRSIVPMYDLRQGAVNNVLPFREDPKKLQFHVSLLTHPACFKSITLHVGEKTVAGIVGPSWKGSFSVGVFAYSPFIGRHSPGKFLLLMGGEALHEQGLREIDLTPGGAWKWRFANESHDVCELTFFLSRPAYFRAWAKERFLRATKSALGMVKLKPDHLRASLAALRKLTPKQLLRMTKGALARQRRREIRIYAFSAEQARRLTPDHRPPKVNSIEDFLCFTPSEPWQSRQVFLKSVLKRFEAGNLGYSYLEKGVLLHSGWLILRQAEIFFSELGKTYRCPKNTSVLCDFYAHPDSKGGGHYQSSIRQMLIDAAKEPKIDWIYISVPSDDGPSRQIIEEMGFAFVESVFG